MDGLLSSLAGAPPESPESGGLLGLTPTKMAYLAMIAKGLSPYSDLNPTHMLESAQKLKQSENEKKFTHWLALQNLGVSRAHLGLSQMEMQRKLDAEDAMRRDNAGAAALIPGLIGGGGGYVTPDTQPDSAIPPNAQYNSGPAPDATMEQQLGAPDIGGSSIPESAQLRAGPEGAGSPPAQDIGFAQPGLDQAGVAAAAQNEKRILDALQKYPNMNAGYRKTLEDQLKAIRERSGVPDNIADPKEYKKEVTKLQVTKEAQQPQSVMQSNIMVDEINRAVKAIDNKGGTLPTTGLGGSILSNVPGTEAHNLSNLLGPLQSNITVDTLNQMRQSNPSGGAVGNVSNYEDKMLGMIKGSLAQSQDADQLKYNLNRLRNYVYGVSHMKVTPQNADYVLKGGAFLEDAKRALEKGAPRDVVIKRLMDMGIDARGM